MTDLHSDVNINHSLGMGIPPSANSMQAPAAAAVGLPGIGGNAPQSAETAPVAQTDAQLIENGYEPIAVLGKRPVGNEWQKRPNTVEAVTAERAAQPNAISTGLRTGRLVGVDIDTPRADDFLAPGKDARDPAEWVSVDHTARFEALAREVLGFTPMRRVGAKGAMLVYRNEMPIGKITIAGTHAKLTQRNPKHPSLGIPLKAQIEILGVGQQFVAYGNHPDTGKPYTWTNAGALDAEPLYTPYAKLVEVTPDKLHEFADRAAALLTELGYEQVKVSGGRQRERAPREVQRRLDKYPVPREYLERVLACVTPDCDRTTWIAVLGGIKSTPLRGVSEDELDAELLEIAQAWSRGNYGEDGVPANWGGDDDVAHAYDSLDPERPDGTGFGTIYDLAKENGWTKPPPQPTTHEIFAPFVGAAAADRAARGDGDAPASSSLYRREVRIISGAGVKATRVEWLWPGYLARRKLHILGGQKGAGKSTLTFDLLATISVGGKWPDGTQASLGDVLVWSSEDDFADTILPRFLAAGGNQDRLYFVEGTTVNGEKQPFDPAHDMAGLIYAARKLPDLKAIMIDPIVSAVAGDSHKNAETRRGLQPLVDLAAEAGAALIGITHFTKNTQGREPIERITGSLAFGALPRLVFGAVRGADENSPRRLVRIASNIGRDGGGFEYTLHQILLPEYDFTAQRVIWGNPLVGTAKELLDDGQIAPSEKRKAVEFLKDQLTAAGADGVLVTDLKKAAEAHNLAWRTVERSKRELPLIRARKRSTGAWCWVWAAVEGAA